MIKSAVQGIAIFIGVQFFMSQIMGKKAPTTTAVTDESGTVIQVPANTAEIPPFLTRPDSLSEGAIYNPIPQRIAPMWPLDSPLDITIVVSPSFVATPLAKVPKERIVVDEIAFKFGDYKENRVIDTEFDVPKEVQNNGTLWAHFYIGLTGSKLDPKTQGYDPARAFHFMHPLTQYIAQKKVKKTKNLLAAMETDEEVGYCSGMGRLMLMNDSSKKKFLLVLSSTRITILTSPCLSSRTLESCNTQVCIRLFANTSI